MAHAERSGMLRLAGQHDLEIGSQSQASGGRSAIPHGQEINAQRLVRRHEHRQFGFNRCPAHVIRDEPLDAELHLVVGPGIVQGMIGRRVPLAVIRIVKIQRFSGQFAGDDVGPIGGNAVLLRVSARAGVQPAVGHYHNVARALASVWS